MMLFELRMMIIAFSLAKIEAIERTEAVDEVEEEENCKRENICSTFYSQHTHRTSSCMYVSISIWHGFCSAFDACSTTKCVCVCLCVCLFLLPYLDGMSFSWPVNLALGCSTIVKIHINLYKKYAYTVCTHLILVRISLTFTEQNLTSDRLTEMKGIVNGTVIKKGFPN